MKSSVSVKGIGRWRNWTSQSSESTQLLIALSNGLSLGVWGYEERKLRTKSRPSHLNIWVMIWSYKSGFWTVWFVISIIARSLSNKGLCLLLSCMLKHGEILRSTRSSKLTGYLANNAIDKDGYQSGMMVDNSRHKGKINSGTRYSHSWI